MWDKPPSITMNNFTSGTMLTCLACQFLSYNSLPPHLSIANKKPNLASVGEASFLFWNWKDSPSRMLFRPFGEVPQLAAWLCQYYLFSTWLTCNLNPLNSNDNRLLCMGSPCIRGQGETDSPFVLLQWSLGLRLIREAKAYTAAKSAPARPAEFISNLLTVLLGVQIETSSGAHAPEVLSVRSDSMIYRGGRVACVDGGGGRHRCCRPRDVGAAEWRNFNQEARHLESDCTVGLFVLEAHI